jgi:hypothetical protein
MHGIAHGDFMATVHFPTLGDLEIPAEPTFIHVLEANREPNWTGTGPDFTLGDRITTLQEPAGPRVVQRDNVVYWKTKRKINDDLQCN